MCMQLGLNSPFKSGADYWRDGDKAEQRNGTADPMQLPPVGGLFNFRGPREGDGDRSMEALPPMPDWTLTRPYLTGQFLLQVSIICFTKQVYDWSHELVCT